MNKAKNLVGFNNCAAIRLTMKQFESLYEVKFTRNHTGKMREMVSLSTSVIVNHLCQERQKVKGSICEHCYAQRMQKAYKALEKKLRRNTEVLTTVLIPWNDLPYIVTENGYFRFEAFADLNNAIQAANYLNMAAANPQTKFAIWTKNPWFIKQAIEEYGCEKPDNLTVLVSSIFVNEVTDYSKLGYDFIDKVFTVYTKDYAAEHGIEINCGARNCATCLRCYANLDGMYVNELLK